MGDRDRKAALLTKAHRALLRGEKEYRPSVEDETRGRVRGRIRRSIHDILLIVEEMDDEELEKTFESANLAREIEDDEKVPMWALVALLYATVPEGEVPTVGSKLGESEPRDRQAVYIEKAVESGIEEAIIRREKYSADVEVQIEINRGPPLDDPENLDLPTISRKRLDDLLRAGKLSDEEYAKAVRERFDRFEEGETEGMNFRLKDEQQSLDDGGNEE